MLRSAFTHHGCDPAYQEARKTLRHGCDAAYQEARKTLRHGCDPMYHGSP